MTFFGGWPVNRIYRLPVATKVAAMNAFGLLLLCALILGFADQQMSAAMERNAHAWPGTR